MKAKLNITIDEDLVPRSKAYAKKRGKSVSQLIESLLREVIKEDEPSFSEKWRGRFKVQVKETTKYEKLK